MEMTEDQLLANIARKILEDREARYVLFPSEIFDEYAWNMLLHLFVALSQDEILSEKQLIDLVHTTRNIGQRWLYQLAKDGQVDSRLSGDDVRLTPEAVTKLRKYLENANIA